MANPWFRMYAEFATDPKVQMLSETDQRRYIMLLCLRCNGYVTLHETEVAFQLRISESDWAETKAKLVEKKLITNDNNPTAWDKRQYASDSSGARVRKHREKIRNGDVTLHERSSNAVDSDTDTELTDTDVSVVASESLPTCPHQEIIAAYGELLPDLPQPRIWEGTRETNLANRWKWVIADLKKKGKPNDRNAGIAFFRRMFEYIAKRDLLMGRNDRGWSCSLPWIAKADNFAKIIEGNYENKEVA